MPFYIARDSVLPWTHIFFYTQGSIFLLEIILHLSMSSCLLSQFLKYGHAHLKPFPSLTTVTDIIIITTVFVKFTVIIINITTIFSSSRSIWCSWPHFQQHHYYHLHRHHHHQYHDDDNDEDDDDGVRDDDDDDGGDGGGGGDADNGEDNHHHN